jgi:hypothetical protein
MEPETVVLEQSSHINHTTGSSPSQWVFKRQTALLSLLVSAVSRRPEPNADGKDH